jgi:hypothetical protein
MGILLWKKRHKFFIVLCLSANACIHLSSYEKGNPMNDRAYNMYALLTVAGIVYLLGSLILSSATTDSIYFIFGYPISVVCLVLAYIFSRKVNK